MIHPIEGLALSFEFADLYKNPVNPALCRTPYELRGQAMYGEGVDRAQYTLHSIKPYSRLDDGRSTIRVIEPNGTFGEILEWDGVIVGVLFDQIDRPERLGENNQQKVNAVRTMLRKIRWNAEGLMTYDV